MRLQPFFLRDGAVAHPSVTRRDVVERMARDLVKFDAFNNEADAIRSLMWSRRYSPYDVVVLVDDARQAAYQQTIDIMATEMGAP